MSNLNKPKLQSLIDAAVKAHNAVHKADAALYDYANKVWDFDLFDDNILDGCLGGCGHSTGMSADSFIDSMSVNPRR